MRNACGLTRALAVIVAIFIGLSAVHVRAAEDAPFKTVDGMVVYFGAVPAEIIKGHPSRHPEQTMHGGSHSGQHEYHLMIAIFDSATGARISDAMVTASVFGLGLAGATKALEPMSIADTVTYGEFFDLPGADLYTIRLTIERPGLGHASKVEFTFDHRK